ncbi:RNA polymerase sigma factor [Spirillospora sp. CA-294931]|uniref:RNA polymerase sigma factor n=1 Tax=Spirillospora sp. CA-294931 TaxID=3240042 RepID=UPI003D8E47B9
MRGEPGALYDAHAARMYAYCWSLLGDQAAAHAVKDTFAAAVQHPPRGDTVLWMYALARSACAEHAHAAVSFDLSDVPLRAAAGLRSDHREILLLWAGEWLEIADIGRVMDIAPDTARQLLEAARSRFERAVLDLLMRGAPARPDVIPAFEKGRLPRLLASRAPEAPPAWLRDQVLDSCAGEAAERPLTGVTAPNPLVVIAGGKPAPAAPGRGRRLAGFGAVAGIAASAAATVGLLASWPSGKGGDGAGSLTPTSAGQHTPANARTTSLPTVTSPGTTGTDRATNGTSSPAEVPSEATNGDPSPTGTGPSYVPPGTPDTRPETGTPSKPPATTPPPSPDPTTPTPTTPPPTTPPPSSEPPPSTTPTPTPTETPTSEPSPTSNPTPSPSGD